ncbi:MAG: LON peptidase substrate-binding domain-containing protein, partial [Saprospiraceae bacterium]|nr:LON peptidase substrate-binding domain-containing protein [Saprospiraceae bacterium]
MVAQGLSAITFTKAFQMSSDPLQENEIEFTLDEQVDNKQLQAVEDVLPTHLNILPLAQRPVFPGLALPMTFSGKQNVAAIKQIAEKEQGLVGLVLAKEYDQNEPDESELYEVGTAFKILRITPIAPETVQVIGQGLKRFRKRKVVLVKPALRWEVDYHSDPKTKIGPELRAYMMAISSEIKSLLQLNPLFQEQVNLVVSQLNYEAPGRTIDVISNLLSADSEQLQGLLETFDLHERANLLLRLIKEELEVARIQKKIQDQISETVNQQQKEFFLRQQLEAIKKELGIEKDDKESEVEKLEHKLAEKELPEEALKVVKEELNKLRTLSVQSPEFNVTRSYLELIAELPWGAYSEDIEDIKRARVVLDQDHYGLEDVKELILEFLSTVIKRGKIAGSIICLVGPPGVG